MPTSEILKAMVIRQATRSDLRSIVELLADDVLGAAREIVHEPLAESYGQAFSAIEADPNNELVVVEEHGDVVAVLQITFIPYLLNQGTARALIEGVRVASECRGRRIGEQLLQWAIARAAERGCGIVEWTTDKRRRDAKRFYERLGFVATHEGMKLSIGSRISGA